MSKNSAVSAVQAEKEREQIALRIAQSVMRLASPDSSITLHEKSVYHRVLRILNASLKDSKDSARLDWLDRMEVERTKGEDLPYCVVSYPSVQPFWGKTLREAIDASMSTPQASEVVEEPQILGEPGDVNTK